MQVIDSYDVHSYGSPEPSAPLAITSGAMGVQPPISVRGAFAGVIADRAAGYTGPISSEAGRMLWAIQSWYLDVDDQAAAEEALTSHDRSSGASH